MVKKMNDKKDKAGKAAASSKKAGKAKASKSGAKRLRALADNPLVADVVAAALVATAAALRDPAKARRLAAQSGDELGDLAKDGADKGSALWQLALEIGRRSLGALASEAVPAKRKPKARPKAKVPKARKGASN